MLGLCVPVQHSVGSVLWNQSTWGPSSSCHHASRSATCTGKSLFLSLSGRRKMREVLILGAYFPAFCGFDSYGFSDLLQDSGSRSEAPGWRVL